MVCPRIRLLSWWGHVRDPCCVVVVVVVLEVGHLQHHIGVTDVHVGVLLRGHVRALVEDLRGHLARGVVPDEGFAVLAVSV